MTKRCLADRGLVGDMAALMRLLGDATRLRVLGLLQAEEMNVTALCGELDLAQPTVSHHLGLLRSSELLLTRRAGKQIYYSLNPRYFASMEDGSLRLAIGRVRLWLGQQGPMRAAPRAATPAAVG